ncbi:MAG: hypothetical protein LBM95_02810 [Lactobacillales bacterium]|jgi:hypothetical protein|nr:hypothetical protein [Lactobacillales bacterium]
MLEFFTMDVENMEIREQLEVALSGRGAFFMFKQIRYRMGIEQQWFEYKSKAYQNVVKRWCEGNSIPYIEEKLRK